MDWNLAIRELRTWQPGDRRDHLGPAIAFLETELRLTIPPLVRRTWPPEFIDDTLREFLLGLLESPPSASIEHPRSYVIRSFRNCCIDVHRARQRRREVPHEPHHGAGDQADSATTPERELRQRDRAEWVARALARLSIADRVSLKLVDAPEWLTEEEVQWLVGRGNADGQRVRIAIQRARSSYDLTLIFDPPRGGDPGNRRRRLERFRRRRDRARKKLSTLLAEGGER